MPTTELNNMSLPSLQSEMWRAHAATEAQLYDQIPDMP